MGSVTGECAGLGETIVFLKYFEDLPDARQRGKVMYPLREVLLLCLMAVLAGAETIMDIARFGDRKLAFLRRFLPFSEGTPSHDHLGDILASIEAEAFQRGFVAWVASLTGVPSGVIAVDGKHVAPIEGRQGGGSHGFRLRRAPALGAGPGQGGRQGQRDRRHPQAVGDAGHRRGDRHHRRHGLPARHPILALKGNQGTLRDDVELFAAEQKASNFKDTTVSRDKSVDGDHGRIETRTVTVVHDVAWLQERHKWPGLKGVVMVESAREMRDKVERETRFYITSLTLPASQMGSIVRNHWAVENSLHWVMDMVFRDDECRVRTDHAPANFTTIKHIALNLIRRAKSKDSLRLRRKVAAWDDEFLASLIVS